MARTNKRGKDCDVLYRRNRNTLLVTGARVAVGEVQEVRGQTGLLPGRLLIYLLQLTVSRHCNVSLYAWIVSILQPVLINWPTCPPI